MFPFCTFTFFNLFLCLSLYLSLLHFSFFSVWNRFRRRIRVRHSSDRVSSCMTCKMIILAWCARRGAHFFACTVPYCRYCRDVAVYLAQTWQVSVLTAQRTRRCAFPRRARAPSVASQLSIGPVAEQTRPTPSQIGPARRTSRTKAASGGTSLSVPDRPGLPATQQVRPEVLEPSLLAPSAAGGACSAMLAPGAPARSASTTLRRARRRQQS